VRTALETLIDISTHSVYLFDYDLDDADMEAISALGRDGSGRPGPHLNDFDYIPD
jgi:hypothetical protein